MWAKRPQAFHNLTRRFATRFDKRSSKDVDAAKSVLEFINICRENDCTTATGRKKSRRTLFLAEKAVKKLVWSSWKRTDDGDDPHPLAVLLKRLTKRKRSESGAEEEEDGGSQDGGDDDVLSMLRRDVAEVLRFFEATEDDESTDGLEEYLSDWPEPEFVERPPLSHQMAGRSVYVVTKPSDDEFYEYLAPASFAEPVAAREKDLVNVDLVELMTSACCDGLGGSGELG